MSKMIMSLDEKIVFKQDNSAQGKGVFVIDKVNKNLDYICSKGNGVIQRFIKQHGLFEKFMPKSVATLRLTTFIDSSGIVHLKAGYLRFGRGSDTHIQFNSTVRIPININNGELDEIGYINYWDEIKEHPDTKMKFRDNKIPYYEKCKQTIFELHKSVPFVKIIG